MKICRTCKISKKINEFYKRYGNNDGYDTRCMECNSKYYKERYAHGIGVYDPTTKRNAYLLRTYGITLEEFNLLAKDQEFKCAICKLKKILIPDHNHVNEKLRELLCYKCNNALGQVNESETILIAMIKYIRKHNYADIQ